MGVSLVAGFVVPLLLSAGTPPPADERVSPRHLERDLAPLILTAVLDLHSTEYALGRNNRELNPLGLSIGRRVVIKSASMGGIAVIVHRLQRTGRAREARMVKYGVFAVQALIAGSNYHHGRREGTVKQRGHFDYSAR